MAKYLIIHGMSEICPQKHKFLEIFAFIVFTILSLTFDAAMNEFEKKVEFGLDA